MRIGLLGTGRIGSSHAAVLCARPDVDTVVIADLDHDRAVLLARHLGAEAVKDADELIRGGLDGLVIATPTDTHAEYIVTTANAGIPVFCEKPVAIDVPSTIEVLHQVAKTSTPVQIGFQRRFDTGYRAARDALSSGELGDLHRVHLVTADPAPPPADYIARSGGIFRDCHIHDFDILRWTTGREVAQVYAVGANRGEAFFDVAGDVDNSAALLTLDDGTLATLQGSRYNGGGYDVRMELAGSRATYVVGLDGHSPLRSAEPGVMWPQADPWPDFWERFQAAYASEIAAFVGLIKGDPGDGCTVGEALEALYVAEAADLSRRAGRPVGMQEVRP